MIIAAVNVCAVRYDVIAFRLCSLIGWDYLAKVNILKLTNGTGEGSY